MKTLVISVAICFFLLQLCAGQVVPKPLNKDLSNLRNIKATYLVVDDVNSPVAQKYFQVLQSCWTLTPRVELIDYNGIAGKASRTNLFISTYHSIVAGSRNSDLAYLGFRYWCLSEVALSDPESLNTGKKNRRSNPAMEEYDKEILEMPKDTVLRLRKRESQVFDVFDMSEKYFYMWGEGVFRNRLEVFQQFVKSEVMADKEDRDITDDMKAGSDEKELGKLRSSPLYVPNYIFLHDNVMNANATRPKDAESSMSVYERGYKAVSGKELNDKIMNDERGIYYLYMKRFDAISMTLEVINSKTGEMIYHQFVLGAEFDKSMLKKLNAALN